MLTCVHCSFDCISAPRHQVPPACRSWPSDRRKQPAVPGTIPPAALVTTLTRQHRHSDSVYAVHPDARNGTCRSSRTCLGLAVRLILEQVEFRQQRQLAQRTHQTRSIVAHPRAAPQRHLAAQTSSLSGALRRGCSCVQVFTAVALRARVREATAGCSMGSLALARSTLRKHCCQAFIH
jgi:hypothetical protein